jgi:hypothetical protein
VDEDLEVIAEKLRRAERGLQDLAPAIEAFRNTKPHSIIRKKKPHGPDPFECDVIYTAGKLRNREPLVEWAASAGEILYNLRSALEQAACRLSRLHCAPLEPPSGVGFPIFTSESKCFRRNDKGAFRQSSGAHLIRAMSDEAQKAILAVQPYQRASQPKDHPLAILDDLMNHDKHQAPHIVASALDDTEIREREVRNASVRIRERHLGTFVEGDKLMRVQIRRTGPNAKADIELKFALGVAFAKDGPAPGRPFPDALFEVVEYVLKDVFRNRLKPLLG